MPSPEGLNDPGLREHALETMKGLDFITDMPGITFLRPNTVEYHWGGDGGSSLLVRVVDGKHVRLSPLSGGWTGLPESPDDASGNDFRQMAVMFDPRLALEHIKDPVINDNRISGKIGWDKLLVGERAKDEDVLNLKTELVVDSNYRVSSMTMEIVEPDSNGDRNQNKMNFFYS